MYNSPFDDRSDVMRGILQTYPNHFDMDMVVGGKCLPITPKFMKSKIKELTEEDLFSKIPAACSKNVDRSLYDVLENRKIVLSAYFRYKIGYIDDAIDQLRRVIASEPYNLIARADLGTIFCELGQYKEAGSIIDEIKAWETEKLNSARSLAKVNIGYAYRRLGPKFLFKAIDVHEEFIAAQVSSTERVPRAHFAIWKYELARLIWRVFDRTVGGIHDRFNEKSDDAEKFFKRAGQLLCEALAGLNNSNFPHMIPRCWLLFVQLARRYKAKWPYQLRVLELQQITPNADNRKECIDMTVETLDMTDSSAPYMVMSLARELMVKVADHERCEKLLKIAIELGENKAYRQMALLQIKRVFEENKNKGNSRSDKDTSSNRPLVDFQVGQFRTLRNSFTWSPGHPRLQQALELIRKYNSLDSIPNKEYALEGVILAQGAENLSTVMGDCVDCFVREIDNSMMNPKTTAINAWASFLHDTGKTEAAEALYLLGCEVSATKVKDAESLDHQEENFRTKYRQNSKYIFETLQINQSILNEPRILLRHIDCLARRRCPAVANFALNVLVTEFGTEEIEREVYLTIRFLAAKQLLDEFPMTISLSGFVYRKILDDLLFSKLEEGGDYQRDAVIYHSPTMDEFYAEVHAIRTVLTKVLKLNEVKMSTESSTIEMKTSAIICVVFSQDSLQDPGWAEQIEKIPDYFNSPEKISGQKLLKIWLGSRRGMGHLEGLCPGPNVYVPNTVSFSDTDLFESLVNALIA